LAVVVWTGEKASNGRIPSQKNAQLPTPTESLVWVIVGLIDGEEESAVGIWMELGSSSGGLIAAENVNVVKKRHRRAIYRANLG